MPYHLISVHPTNIGGIFGGIIAMPKFTDRSARGRLKPGMHSDGRGLYLHVAPSGARSWILRATVKGRATASGTPYRVEVGLGSLDDVGVKEAREKAAPLRTLARQGINPLDEKRRERLTFAEAAKRVHEELLPTWRNRKHAETWLATVENYANPKFGKCPIEDVSTADVLSVLSPIWTEKHETAKRLKQRLSTVFDWAKGHGHYKGENPVAGVKKALPKVKREAEHMAAMHWRDVPAFMDELGQREGISARTLEFLILTASRSGEARGARWNEIDLEAREWVIPGERMKRGIPHRAPLSEAAVSVLKRVTGLDPDLVFPSVQRAADGSARPQSVMVFKSLCQRMGHEGFTTHGFRSSFRDWCSESANAPHDVAESALSHAVGNAVSRAYARSDLFEQRRPLMDRWGQFATGQTGKVVELGRA